jgi:hypothetical protein
VSPLGRSQPDHLSRVVQLGDSDAVFVAMCTCGTVSPPYTTRDEAFVWANEHSPNVREEVDVLTEEGGVGWQCMFCGEEVAASPLRVSLHWTDEGIDEEQWYVAHRACLAERLAADDAFAPRFDTGRGSR